jgi:hypothetical protein
MNLTRQWWLAFEGELNRSFVNSTSAHARRHAFSHQPFEIETPIRPGFGSSARARGGVASAQPDAKRRAASKIDRSGEVRLNSLNFDALTPRVHTRARRLLFRLSLVISAARFLIVFERRFIRGNDDLVVRAPDCLQSATSVGICVPVPTLGNQLAALAGTMCGQQLSLCGPATRGALGNADSEA